MTLLLRVSFLVYLISFLQCAFATAEEFKEENGVLVLDQSNFDTAVETFDPLLVEFYAPWCGHCKKLEPEYLKAAEELKKHNPPIHIAKIDSIQNKEITDKYQVLGFPAIKLLKNGRVIDYDGGRTSDDIVNFMKQKFGPVYVKLTSVEMAKTFFSEQKAVAVALLKEDSSDFLKIFENIAFTTDNVKFAFSTDPVVKEFFDVNIDSEVIVIARSLEEEKIKFDLSGRTTQEEVATFIVVNTAPLVVEFGPSNAKQIFEGPIKVHLLLFANRNVNNFVFLERGLTPVARQTKGKITHVIVPSTETRVLDFFGVKPEDLPRASIIDMRVEPPKKYFFSGELSVENLIEFEANFLAGLLKPSFKSQKPSETDDTQNVKVIVSDTFHEKVMNNDKHVLLEFYAPWCGHCKSFAPEYEKIANKLAHVKDLVVAKIDATANDVDHPKVNIRGFPTILLFPANAKDTPIVYSGEKKLKAIESFLEKHKINLQTEEKVTMKKHDVEHSEF